MDNPEEYAAKGVISYRRAEEVVAEFRDEIKSMHGRIIDIGCGPGNVTREIILPRLPDDAVIVGADISPDMVKHAEEQNKDEKRLSFLQLDIETPELPIDLIGNYDNAFSFYCIHWCKKMKVVLNNIYKLLRPGGRGLILFISDHPLLDVYLKHQNDPKYSVYMKNVANYISPHHGLANPEESFKNELEETGFEVLHCTNRWKTFNFPKLDIYFDLIMSVNPCAVQMPEKLQKEYRNDMKREMKRIYENSIDEDDVNSNECPIVEKHTILVAYFRKPIQKKRSKNY